MSTVAALIEETRAHLMGAHTVQLNKLSTTMNTSVASVVMDYDTSFIARGSTLCIGDELMYVWALNPATRTATVERGYLGTTAAAHTAGDLIESNPRFPTPMIRAELKKEIASWDQRIWTTTEVEIAIGATERTVNLTSAPANFLHVLRVRTPVSSTVLTPRNLDFRVERGYGDYASGTALILNQTLGEAQTVSVLYATPFVLTTFTDATDLVDDIGIPSSALDIPPLGAAWRLLSTREVSRTNIESAPEPRVAQDVPAGHIIQTARQLKQIRDERIGEEGRLLNHRYGMKRQ